jgi:hypothetical protein
MTADHLAQAERHVAEGERHVARQRELIAELERDGHDTVQARELLVQFEGLQVMHVADRDRLRREFASLERGLTQPVAAKLHESRA